MQKDTLIGSVALLIIIIAVIGYTMFRSVPSKTPVTTPVASVLPADGEYVEHATYYDIVTNYATSTPLTEPANSAAIALMKNFVGDTITQFKTDGNFDNLSAEDITMMGYDQGRKQTLDIKYLISISASSISYIYTIYTDTLGAHGNMFFRTFTFDARSGAPLALTDLFIPGSNYLDKLSQISRAALPTVIGEGSDDNYIKGGTTPEEGNFKNFFFGNKEFIVLFPPYQVAPYAAGPQTLRIPLSSLSSILKTEYR